LYIFCFIDKNIETVLITATENNMSSKSDLTNDKPWTRQEDMILLQNIKKEYSENSFLLISEKLENRTVDQVIFYLFLIYIYIYIQDVPKFAHSEYRTYTLC